MRLVLCLICFLGLLASSNSHAGLKVYYVRHGEAGYQVVKEWQDKPKDSWPVYVGSGDLLTPKGDQQALALAERLKSYHFDFIATSPIPRAELTIQPYLKQEGLTAEIWPGLAEIDGSDMDLPVAGLPQPNPALYNGNPIVIPEGSQDYFKILPDANRNISWGHKGPQLGADLRAVMAKNIQMIRSRFGGTNKSILLVGHAWNGEILLRLLVNNDKVLCKDTGDGHWVQNIWIANAAMWMAEEQPDGTFKVMMVNDKPYTAPTLASQAPGPRNADAVKISNAIK